MYDEEVKSKDFLSDDKKKGRKGNESDNTLKLFD